MRRCFQFIQKYAFEINFRGMAEKALFVDFCFHRIDSFLQRLLLYMPRADCCTEFRPLKVPTNHENLVFNE